MLLFMSVDWVSITRHSSSLKSCRNISDRVLRRGRGRLKAIDDPPVSAPSPRLGLGALTGRLTGRVGGPEGRMFRLTPL
jgi:hypothetical protein